MVLLDYIILIVVVLAFIQGFRAGLLRQIASFGALVLGGWFAKWLAPSVSSFLTGVVHDCPDYLNHVLSYLIAFLIIAGALYAVALFFGRLLKGVGMGIFNSLLGSVLSVFTALLIFSLVINAIIFLDGKAVMMKEETRSSSFFFYRLQGLSNAVFPYVGELYEEGKKLSEKILEDEKKEL